MTSAACTCAVRDPRHHTCPRHGNGDGYGPLTTRWDAGDLVPGYTDSADGRADARDQAKADREQPVTPDEASAHVPARIVFTLPCSASIWLMGGPVNCSKPAGHDGSHEVTISWDIR